jgi:hypothetical protein
VLRPRLSLWVQHKETRQGNNNITGGLRDRIELHPSLSSRDVVKGDERTNSIKLKTAYDQTAKGLPPMPSAGNAHNFGKM